MKDLIAYIIMMGALSGGDSLPFWATANQYGIYPESSGALAQICLKSEFDDSKSFHYRFGASGAIRADKYLKGQSWNRAFLADEAYASIGWKCLTLDVGMKHPELDFYGPSRSLGSLSSTGGHLTMTGNARSLPGYNLILEPVAFPGTKGHLMFWGLFGDYIGTDNPYTKNRLYHRTKAFTKIYCNPTKEWYITLGLDHYALWGGYDPVVGYARVNFKNYLRVITGGSAGGDGTGSDQLNVIGDQGGSETIGFGYEGRDYIVRFQHEKPYSDKSGMKLFNFPDGVNTLSFSFRDKKRWVSDIVYELYYTKFQSGSDHRETIIDGQIVPQPGDNYVGVDNYYNNGEFRSGWTYYNRPLTSPLFFPAGTLDGTFNRYMLHPMTIDKTQCIAIENNRVMAHHFGISGLLGYKAPYKLMATISQNYGIYTKPYKGQSSYQKGWDSILKKNPVKEQCLVQFSIGFSGEVPNLGGIPGLSLTYGIYSDLGEVLQNQTAIIAGVKYVFFRR